MIGTGSVELGEQFAKEHVTAAIALVDCMDQKAGSQTGLADPGAAQPYNILALGHESQRVVECYDFFGIELGLPIEGKSLNDPRFCNVGLSESELAQLLTFNPILLFDDVAQQAPVGKVLIAGQLEIIVPMSEQLAQVQVLELCSQGLIHDFAPVGLRRSTGRVDRSESPPDKRCAAENLHRVRQKAARPFPLRDATARFAQWSAGW
jgi:hypothetical protein